MLQYLDRQQIRLWSLIEAQQEFKTIMHEDAKRIKQPVLDLMQCVNRLTVDCETQIWQIVPIQLQLRLELLELKKIVTVTAPAKKVTMEPVVMLEKLDMSLIRNGTQKIRGKFACTKCNRTYELQTSLKRHMKKHVRRKSIAQRTTARAALNEALRRSQMAAENQSGSTQNAPAAGSVPVERETSDAASKAKATAKRRKFACPKCNQLFNRSQKMYWHLKKVHGRRKSVSQKRRSRRETVQTVVEESSQAKSPVTEGPKGVSATAKAKNDRKQTEAEHPSREVNACTICSSSYSRRYDLKRHGQHKHREYRAFTCKSCGVIFMNNTLLLDHAKCHEENSQNAKPSTESASELDVEETPSEIIVPEPVVVPIPKKTVEKKHCCQICKKCFLKPYELKRHMGVHAKAQRRAAFSTEPRLKLTDRTERPSSVQTMNNNIGPDPLVNDASTDAALVDDGQSLLANLLKPPARMKFPCAICKKSFDMPYILKRHMKIHESGECTICKKQCETLYGLTRHMAIHARRKSIAKKSAQIQMDTNIRLASPTTNIVDRPDPLATDIPDEIIQVLDVPPITNGPLPSIKRNKFICTTCNKGFDYRYSLNRHMQIHTRENAISQRISNFSLAAVSQTPVSVPMEHPISPQIPDLFIGPETLTNDNLSSEVVRMNGHYPNPMAGAAGVPKQPKPKNHACTKCNMAFHVPFLLARHMNAHARQENAIARAIASGRGIHTCSICKKLFVQLRSLKRHMQSRHSRRKSFSIPRPTFYVDDKSQLAGILERPPIATDSAPTMAPGPSGQQVAPIPRINIRAQIRRTFFCATCKKTFTLASSLKRHMLTHARRTSTTFRAFNGALYHDNAPVQENIVDATVTQQFETYEIRELDMDDIPTGSGDDNQESAEYFHPVTVKCEDDEDANIEVV